MVSVSVIDEFAGQNSIKSHQNGDMFRLMRLGPGKRSVCAAGR